MYLSILKKGIRNTFISLNPTRDTTASSNFCENRASVFKIESDKPLYGFFAILMYRIDNPSQIFGASCHGLARVI
jgi:hypothetical protein